jgi:hypothetical protein
MSSVVTIGVSLAILQATAAQPRAPDTSAAQPTYTSHLLLGELPWIAVGAAGLTTRSPEIGIAAAAAFVAGGPIVHLINGEPRNAGWSAGLRVSLPVAGGAITAGLLYVAACPDEHDDEKGDGRVCPLLPVLFGSVLGGSVGAVAALVVDYTQLTRRTPRERSWTPTVTADGRGVSLGVAGRF